MQPEGVGSTVGKRNVGKTLLEDANGHCWGAKCEGNAAVGYGGQG